MTPEQALQNLSNAAATARLTAQEHAVCQEAAKVLIELIRDADAADQE